MVVFEIQVVLTVVPHTPIMRIHGGINKFGCNFLPGELGDENVKSGLFHFVVD